MNKQPSNVSVIAEGLIITGNISGEGDMQLAGCVEGEISLKNGRLFVEQKGFVEGNVRVREISISGEVRGTIEAGTRVTISSTGKIKGDVKTCKIDIAEGAFLCGEFNVEDRIVKNGE